MPHTSQCTLQRDLHHCEVRERLACRPRMPPAPEWPQYRQVSTLPPLRVVPLSRHPAPVPSSRAVITRLLHGDGISSSSVHDPALPLAHHLDGQSRLVNFGDGDESSSSAIGCAESVTYFTFSSSSSEAFKHR